MEIKDLIEITPEIKAEVHKMLEASRTLKKLIGDRRHYSLESDNNKSILTIFDRHEYSRDGLGTDLGFYVRRFYSNSDDTGTLDFIAEHTIEAQEFSRQFDEFMGGE